MEKLSRAECMKLIRDEEKKLQAAIHEDKRREYVQWIHAAFSEKQLGAFVKRMEQMLAAYLTPEELADEKHIEWLRVDMLFCYFYYGCDFDEYFLYFFERKTHLQRSQYVTQNRREAWYKKFNRPDLQIIYDDKGRTYDVYKKYFKRECFTVRTEEDEAGFLDFVSRHEEIFVKDAMGYCGQGIQKVRRGELGDLHEYFLGLVKRAPVHLEELICQGKEMADIHPKSVNTVRILTVTDRKGGIHILECCLRVGRGGAVVDNYSNGGILCVIDPYEGIIVTDGMDKRNLPVLSHPDTGVAFRGFRLPAWDQFMALVEELVTVVPEVRLYGWDLAWSQDGWVLVEANQCPELNGQENFGCGFLPIFNALL